MSKKIVSLIFSILFFVSFAQAQTAEVMVSLNEQFFEAVLDATFKNLKQPDFPLSDKESIKFPVEKTYLKFSVELFSVMSWIAFPKNSPHRLPRIPL